MTIPPPPLDGDVAPDDPDPAPTSGGDPAREPVLLDDDARRGLEAVLFLADEPVDLATLADLLEAVPEDVEVTLRALAETYLADDRGMEVRAVAGGWRMYTAAAAKPVVERWALAGRTGRLTQAALETLAVIAYKQPISRQEIGEIRGVNADGAVRSLVARGLVADVGRDPGPGQAVLYGTTRMLLERLGLGSIDELPPLTDFLPEMPAPDEPELSALRSLRRRLAAGGELPTRTLGGRSDQATNTGSGDDRRSGDDAEDDDVLPAPSGPVGHARADDEMDALSDRLDVAARNAVDRLRAAVAAGQGGEPDPDPTDPDPTDPDPTGPDPTDPDPTDPDPTGPAPQTGGPEPDDRGVPARDGHDDEVESERG